MTADHLTAHVDDLARIRHHEAMELTATENQRLLTQLHDLSQQDWGAATDCTGWTVRDVVVHLIASAQAQASPLEFARQVRAGRPPTAEIGGQHWVDGLNEAQLRARVGLTPGELPALWQHCAAAALTARRRMPALVRALPPCSRWARPWAPSSDGSRWATCSTSGSPATCGCTASTSPAPPGALSN